MEMMGFNDCIIILISALCVVSIFRYLRVSSIIGYLLTGFLIGPYNYNLISSQATIDVLAEIGIVFLLFMIGMKLSLKRLYSMRLHVLGLGSVQVVLTVAVFAFLAFMIQKKISVSTIMLSSGLALSSTAIAVQTLTENNDLSTRYGRISFAILLAQDFGMILLLISMNSIASPAYGGSISSMILRTFFYTSAVFASIVLIGRFVFRPLYRFVAKLKNQEIFSATSLLVVLGTGLIAQKAGIPMEIGAFIAGVMIAETEYRSQCEADITPFYGLLLGLFFLSIGMKVSINVLTNNLLVISGALVAFLSIKGVIIFISCLMFRVPLGTSMRTSLLLAGGGEFAFIIIEHITSKQQLINKGASDMLVIIVVLSMALTPLLAHMAKIIEETLLKHKPNKFAKDAHAEVSDLNNHVIIVGFNQIGLLMAKILKEQLIPYVAIDNDMRNVSLGRKESFQVYYGDATRLHVLTAISAEKAKAIMVCLDDETAARTVATISKQNFPKAVVAASLQRDDIGGQLSKIGIKVAKPKYIEPGLELAAITLTEFHFSEEEIKTALSSFRKY